MSRLSGILTRIGRIKRSLAGTFAWTGTLAFKGKGAHRYWRLNIINHSSFLSIDEIELRSSIDGADQTGSGIASASEYIGEGYEASKAVDDTASTEWVTNSYNDAWWKYDFGIGNYKEIVEIAITPRDGGFYTQAPRYFTVEYSDNDADWTVAFIVGHIWADGDQQVFHGPDSDPHRFWKILVRYTAGNYVGMSEIELRASLGGADQTGSGTATVSFYYSDWTGEKAVDNNTGTAWATYDQIYPQWWKYDFGIGNDIGIVELAITPRVDGPYNEAPAKFYLQYSDTGDNGDSWDTLDYFETTWPDANQQVFSPEGYFSLAGILGKFIGILSRFTHLKRSLAGTFPWTATLSRFVHLKRTLDGTFSWAGDVVSLIGRAFSLSGILGFTGILSRLAHLNRSLDGTFSWVGTVVSLIGRAFSLDGILEFTGALSRFARLKRSLTGTFSWIGSVAIGRARSLAGMIQFTGNLIAFLFNQRLSGTIGFSGVVTSTGGLYHYFCTLNGTLTFSGDLENSVEIMYYGVANH